MIPGSCTKSLAWLRQLTSFAPSRIILTANNYRIFDHLTGTGKTAKALSGKLGTDPRATGLLLNSLAALGLLILKGGRYRNTAVASRYLVRGKQFYQGDIIAHTNSLWDSWSGLDTVLKTGKPARKGRNLEAFIMGMHNLALLKVRKVIGAIDLKGVKTVLDLGGGPGTYSMEFAHKRINTVLMDFPETLSIAKRLIDASALRGITLLPGDFTTESIGSGYDLIFISQIFHAYDEKTCINMLKKTVKALNPGGRVVIQEFFLNETKTAPLQGALFAINMLVNTTGGRTYTPHEMVSWMNKTGFRDMKSVLLDETVLIEGYKK